MRRMETGAMLVAGMLLALVPVQALARPIHASRIPLVALKPPLSVADAAALKPGHFLWRPDLSTDGAVDIQVDLDRQLIFVLRGGVLIGLSTVSSGRDGYESPIGAFTILEKQVTHRSNRYNDAPMPYMQRLTWDGVALHAGGVPGYRESHGCVHLPMAFAKLLYGITDVGATVEMYDAKAMVTMSPPAPNIAPLARPETIAVADPAPAAAASAAAEAAPAAQKTAADAP